MLFWGQFTGSQRPFLEVPHETNPKGLSGKSPGVGYKMDSLGRNSVFEQPVFSVVASPSGAICLFVCLFVCLFD